MQQSLNQLSSIEHRLDRLENQGVVTCVIGTITGSTNKELITLIGREHIILHITKKGTLVHERGFLRISPAIADQLEHF